MIPRLIFQTKTLFKKLSKLVEVPALAGIPTKITTNLILLLMQVLQEKNVINAPSGNNNENAGPKEVFKYDLIEHLNTYLHDYTS